MNTTLKQAILKRKDPMGYELNRIRAEMLDLQKGGLKDIAELVFRQEVEKLKAEIVSNLEFYIGEVTETLIKENIKGEEGIQGIQGPEGKEGKPGPKGDPGKDGANGTNGTNGRDGKNGTNGRDGAKGEKGDPGNSVAVEDVLAMVKPEVDNLIQETKRVVKSLKVEKQGGGGGGGMGAPTTFSFTGNGVLTDFTLSTKVAANGMAIWAYVNGQWIQPGVHFTVSNRTLSTTFTPANGDTIEGFYLRA